MTLVKQQCHDEGVLASNSAQAQAKTVLLLTTSLFSSNILELAHSWLNRKNPNFHALPRFTTGSARFSYGLEKHDVFQKHDVFGWGGLSTGFYGFSMGFYGFSAGFLRLAARIPPHLLKKLKIDNNNLKSVTWSCFAPKGAFGFQHPLQTGSV